MSKLSLGTDSDLVVQVFSMLDTQSLCYASAACSLFSKCAKDPMCYANLDLTTLVPKVNNAVVATMVQRAGKALRYENVLSVLCFFVPEQTLINCTPGGFGV